MRYKIPKEIPVVFHNGSTYDYHFIIKELVKKFKGNFECLGENTEKYITFSVPIKKKIENKDMEITYKIKFIDSFRFMATSLSNLVDNLTKGIHTNKYLDCNSCLDYVRITKNEKLLLKCFNCDIYYKKKSKKDLIKKFKNTYSFCNNDLNKFILLLRKGVYPYEYMDSLESSSILADELHKPIIKIFEKRKVYSQSKDNIWGVDLADMQSLSRKNKGIKYLLCVIDLYSKYAFVIPLKDKKGISILNAFDKIIKQYNRKPNKIWVDQGGEFYNNIFKRWLSDNDIIMYSTYNEGKSVVAERFIKTLKSKCTNI